MKQLKIISGFIFILGLVTLIVGCNTSVSAANDAYVTLDINPSIELIVSPREKVVYANPLNEDGEVLLAELDLIGMDLDEAIDLIIETAIELGYIDVDSEETIVEITALSKDEAIGEQIREQVRAHVNKSFQDRAMMGRAQDKGFTPEFLAEAEGYGVTPGFLALAKAAVLNDDTLTLEDALLMEVDELQAIIKTAREAFRQVAQGVKEEFLAEKEALMTTFLAEKQALEEAIAAAEGDTTELEAELEALIAAHHEAMTALRDEFLVESEALRAQYKEAFQNRYQQHHQRYENFMNQMQQRRQNLEDEIEEFQNRRP